MGKFSKWPRDEKIIIFLVILSSTTTLISLFFNHGLTDIILFLGVCVINVKTLNSLDRMQKARKARGKDC